MSFVRRPSSVLGSLLAASLAGILLAGAAGAAGAAGTAGAARQPAPQHAALKARVGQSGRVELAASALSPGDLARLRPGYESLKPRVHTNTE